MEGSRAKFLRPKVAGSYEEETEAIRERSKSPEAQKAHKFQASEWTLPNGHPRCRVCGDEEPEGGECSGIHARKTASPTTLTKAGYDGIVGTYTDGSKEIVAFHPEQVSLVRKPSKILASLTQVAWA